MRERSINPTEARTCGDGLRILLWHRERSWTASFVRGRHAYLVPVTDDRVPDGRSQSHTLGWPENVVEIDPGALRDEPIDVVVLQRPHELDLVERWTGRRPGVDVPAVFVEHGAPRGPSIRVRHALADREDIPIVHITRSNQLRWDNGKAANTVIEHGIVDPGYRWTGTVPHAGTVINEPIRRRHVSGTDLLLRLSRSSPVDVFGKQAQEMPAALDCEQITPQEALPQPEMRAALAERRVYLHTYLWTSAGSFLVEAMHLGMPVVAVAAPEIVDTVPPEAGVICKRDAFSGAVAEFLADPDRARETGQAARRAAVRRYSLTRFLNEWDALLEELRG